MERKSKQELTNPKIDELISQTQAAKLRGISRAAISDLIRRGRLQTVEVGGRPLLYRSEVENFEKIVEGRPPKAKVEK